MPGPDRVLPVLSGGWGMDGWNYTFVILCNHHQHVFGTYHIPNLDNVLISVPFIAFLEWYP